MTDETAAPQKSNLKLYVTILLVLLGVVSCVQLSHYYVRLPEIQRLGVSSHMKKQAEQAVQLAHDQFDVELDYSPESVQEVEKILASEREHYLRDSRDRRSLAPVAWSNLWGAYIGEVIKSVKKSEWKYDPETEIVTLQFTDEIDKPEFMPMKWCYRRIAEGKPEDNVWYQFLLVTLDPRAREFREALEQQAPPDE
ncbi:MAG TPA: hypothetical protein DCY03_16400 [Planctomycetaceae bacterium]|uniref:hypothetical protein n=1 Tax=Gimesia maris TaxID=122 RepID=UPI000E83BF90|nr:hypothetical protein [Planctomycetaceae bacterium]|tara:strand:+ start:1160 stop:1747 length:588 start_codon:yes stop_codon:yes gene_type:complete